MNRSFERFSLSFSHASSRAKDLGGVIEELWQTGIYACVKVIKPRIVHVILGKCEQDFRCAIVEEINVFLPFFHK